MNFAQLPELEGTFGDRIVLVGPHATGKSLTLRLLKLAVDASRVSLAPRQRRFDWTSWAEF